jgi:hypothetical protein
VKVLDVASARSARIRRARITCAIKDAKRLIEFPFRAFISMIFLAIPSMRSGTRKTTPAQPGNWLCGWADDRKNAIRDGNRRDQIAA